MKAFRITLARDDEDLAVALLWDAGTAGIESLPPHGGAAPFLPFPPESGAVSDESAGQRVQLLVYFSDDRERPVIQAALAPLADTIVEPAEVPDVDWVARFRETFRAFEVGRFRLAPPWDPPDARATHLVVDPGRAFGTGTHETTRLCLLALQGLAESRNLGDVVDIGTGTGILAVAALRLGAVRAVALDIDPEATASARVHARLNDVPLLVVQGDGGRSLRAACFDIVLANLMAPLLLDRRAELVQLARPGGILILSGLLQSDVAEVRRAYEVAGPADVRTDGEWAALVVRTPA